MISDESGRSPEGEPLPADRAADTPQRPAVALPGGPIETYYAPLYRFAMSLTGHEAEAADLTQQTFYLWAAKGHQLRDDSKLKVWLFTVLHREFLAQKRDRARYVCTDEMGDTAAAETYVPASVIEKLDGAIAHKALLSLEDTFRAPLALFYLEQHSYREIAEILAIPIGTVMSRIQRGKIKLRKLLAREAEGGPRGAEEL
jgi:RNA polymerase sigma factor (sigma-70 family)